MRTRKEREEGGSRGEGGRRKAQVEGEGEGNRKGKMKIPPINIGR